MSQNVKSFISCLGLALCLLMSALSWPMMRIGNLIAQADFINVDYAEWATSAFVIAEVAMIPVAGRLADHFGLRKCVIFGSILFIVASIACTEVNEMKYLAAVRAVQGLGSAFLFASAFTIPGVLIPHGERGTVHGIMTGAFAIGSLFGAAAGVYLSLNPGWRYMFYIPAVCVAIGAIMTVTTLPAHETRLRDFDVLGAIVLFFLLLIGMAYTQSVHQHFEMFSLESALFLTLIILLTVTLYHREREAANPIIPRSFRGFKVKEAVAIMLISTVALGLLQFFVKIYVLEFCDLSDIGSYADYIYQACGMFVFLLIGGAITALPGGHIVPYTGARPWCMFGFVMTSFGLLLTTYFASSSIWCMAGCLFVLGLGLGSLITLLLVSMQGMTPKEDMGATSSLTMGLRMMAIASGLALYNEYTNTKVRDFIHGFDPTIGPVESLWDIIVAILLNVDEFLAGTANALMDGFSYCAFFAVFICLVGFVFCYLWGDDDKGLCPPHVKKKKKVKKQ